MARRRARLGLALAFASLPVLAPARARANVLPQLVDATLASLPSYSVALCVGDNSFNCATECGGTLIAPNLVLTSRHCADVTRVDSLDCSTYRFGGKLSAPGRFWVTAASRVSNAAPFHRGAEWSVPLANGCGHDLALLVLQEPVPATEAIPSRPSLASDAIVQNAGALLDVYGYGRAAPDAAPDGQRRGRKSRVLCVGARDTCSAVPGGSELLATEFAMDAIVCPGDSGSGVFDPQSQLLGPLARSIGPASPCAYGVYTSLSIHALWLARGGRAAAARGGYSTPTWVADAEALGNDATRLPRAFGAPCDDAADCADRADRQCRSHDNGVSWSCVRPCNAGCDDGTCHFDDSTNYCFAEAPAERQGCAIVGRDDASTLWASTAITALAALAVRGRRKRP